MSTTINTLFIGKVLKEFDSLPSTNQYAQELLAGQSPAEGTVIITHDQYAGKGQMNNKWESEPGKNLSFTTILYPGFLPARQQFFLNQAVSLGVFDTLEDFITSGLTIKWPNDIYVFNKKITGILIQNTLKGAFLQNVIVGIGININQAVFISDAPNPTSVLLETGKKHAVKRVMASLCENLETRYLQLKSGNFALLKKDYKNNLFRLEKEHLFKKKTGEVFSGKIMGTTEGGKLRIFSKQGEETFGFKEVEYII